MILAVDVGNTNIVIGCLGDKEKHFEGRLSTEKSNTEEEYAIKFKNVLELHSINSGEIEGGILSSVVSQITGTLEKAIEMVIGKKPMVVGPGLKTGLNIKIDNPAQLGADLVVGAVASTHKYPLPQIIFDLGTATTVSVIDKDGGYIGGLIIPGIITSLNALSIGTAQLPHIELKAPRKIINSNTVDCMCSGSVYGTVAMLDGVIDMIENELNQKLNVIATGGLAELVVPHCRHKIIYDDNLLLEGLLLIYNKNK